MVDKKNTAFHQDVAVSERKMRSSLIQTPINLGHVSGRSSVLKNISGAKCSSSRRTSSMLPQIKLDSVSNSSMIEEPRESVISSP